MEIPGYKIDPVTGKYVPVKCDFEAYFSGTRPKRQTQESSNSGKSKDSNWTQPSKYRKTETGVRKELFKHPIKNQEKPKESTRDYKSGSSNVRKMLVKSLPSKNDSKLTMPKKPEPVESSHMITIVEESEEKNEPAKKDHRPKSPITPQIKSSATCKEDKAKTPDSFGSCADFLRLEKLCKSPMITKESPVSSVCNMFESNMLLYSEKKTANNNNQRLSQTEIIAQIRKTVKHNQELYQETSNKIKEIVELRACHEENTRKILELVDKLEGCCEENNSISESDEKENSAAIKRRSLRLQNKSPSINMPRPSGSPVILKAGDLRKSTLTKSLVFKCQKYQIESPRIQKAIDMYNSTRSACTALQTPKISRNQFNESPRTLNWRTNLSLKVQEQCLLLQDTPVHK